MEEWERTLGQTFYNLRPAGYDKNQHKFELVDFVQLVKCCVCGKYLNGIFFQGYACSRCQSICHKECLINNNEICCHEDANILKNDKFDKVLDELVRKIPENRSILNSEPEEPTLLDEKIPIDKKDYLFIAKVFFPYDGKPIPPYLNQRFLELSIGQFVRVTETNFGECWKGYISVSDLVIDFKIYNFKEIEFIFVKQEDIQTKEEIVGLFPQKYVRVWTPDEVNLENVNESNYMWYLSAEREYAELILRRLSESSEKLASSTLFLLRPKQDLKHKDSCAAISFMYNKVVNHVLVKNDVDEDADEEIDPQTNETKKAEKYYISKIKFNSIVELVNYYRKNSLSEIISDFNTTLEIPYLQVLPNSIGKVIAQENYIPPGSNKNIANQIKLEAGRHYFLVRKESNAWWLIYNQEGLLGLAPVSYLKECNNKTSFLRNKSNIRNSDI